MKKIIAFCMVLLVVLAACEKNSFQATDRTYPPDDAALVKIAWLSATTTTFNVQIFLNGERVSYPLPYNTPYPGGGLGTGGSNNSDFLIVKPGETKVELNVPNPGTDVIAYKYYETTQNFLSAKRQTLFIADTGANITSWLVMVDTERPDSGFGKVQFVNAMPNVPSVDFYRGSSVSAATLVMADVKYKQATDYIPLPFATDSFYIRPAGTPITTAPIGKGGIRIANQRMYTVYARGYNGTTGTRAPAVSAIINN